MTHVRSTFVVVLYSSAELDDDIGPPTHRGRPIRTQSRARRVPPELQLPAFASYTKMGLNSVSDYDEALPLLLELHGTVFNFFDFFRLLGFSQLDLEKGIQ